MKKTRRIGEEFNRKGRKEEGTRHEGTKHTKFKRIKSEPFLCFVLPF